MIKAAVYNPLNVLYKSKIGAIKENKKIIFKVKGEFSSVVFVCHKDGENPFYIPMEKAGKYFKAELSFTVGLYWYKFQLDNGLFIGCGDNLTGVITDNPSDFQLSVYCADYKVPQRFCGGVIYQIFPDRFNRSEFSHADASGKKLHKNLSEDPVFLPNADGEVKNDDFFGGNLKGITEKLPYLKSLNVTAIYLNPIFKAFSNHRYDTGDFMKIDSLLGDERDFKELIDQAARLNIDIIMDFVFNHVGADSLYFNKYGNYPSCGAYQSKKSEYYKWFDFSEYPDEYRCWWGVKTLPATNKTERSYIDFICGAGGVIDRYAAFGIKGIRLDVVDELPKNFVREIRKRFKSASDDNLIIGEVWEDASNKISYGERREYFLGKELDSVMNYPLKNAVIEFVKTGNSRNLSSVVKTQTDHYPKQVLNVLMNIMSTHDTARLLSAVSDFNPNGKTKSELSTVFIPDNEMSAAVFRLKAASLLQYTLFGVPSLYYGDEAGMQGHFDPLNRRFYPWDKENAEILEWYKLLGTIRSETLAFKDGRLKEIYARNGFYAFKRIGKQSEVLVTVNVSDGEFSLKFKGALINLIDNVVYDGKITVKGKFLGIFKKIRQKTLTNTKFGDMIKSNLRKNR